jgi:hypothetical protein
MGTRFLLRSVCVAILSGLCSSSPATACPYCKADATGLAATAAPPADDAGDFPVMISGGFDVPSAFYFRGYLQADHGPIFQPYLNIFTARTFNEDIVVRPYVALFHSAHWDSDNRMADMSDVMVGAVTTANGLSLDARYAFYTMNPLMRSHVHELGAKASFDVFSLNDDYAFLKPFSLRPFAGLYGELSDENGTDDLFLNVGLEPSWRFEAKGRKFGVSLPIDWGLSADDYYLDSDGEARPVVPQHVSPVPAPRRRQRAGHQRWR